jgi:cytochrome P450
VTRKNLTSGPRFRTPFGLLAVMRRDPLGFFMDCTRRYGDLVDIRFPPFRNFLVTHPRDVEHVLQTNHRNYWKGTVMGRLKRITGDGLVFSDGALWRRQRQLAQPAFHRDRIAAMGDMMTATTAHMLDRWQAQAATGQPFDIAPEMSGLTLEIVAQALFGTDFGDDKNDFVRAVLGALAYANHLLNHLFTPPLAIPTPANLRGRRAIATIDRIVGTMIDARRRDGTDRGDLLTMLIRARAADTDTGMNDKQLRDECVTFLSAGHETTAVTLSWALHLLSTHPIVERRLYHEVSDVLGDLPPTFEHLAHLPFTRMVLEEALRLYPPAWAVPRQAYEDDELGGQRVPAGTTVTVCPYVTHRNPAFWEHPEAFDPERFTPERSAARPEYAYYPFGGGPRGCIGRQFAMMEAQLVLAMVVQRFRLERVSSHPVVPDPVLTLRPRHGVLMSLRPRAGTG